MAKPSQMKRVEAAQLYINRVTHTAERQAELELRAFMSIFHPEVPPEKVREMVRDSK